MNRPLYRDHDPGSGLKSCPPPAHRGLWFDRFFDRYGPECKVPDQGKQDWIKTVIGKCGEANDIGRCLTAQRELVTHLNGESREFATDWNFTTGLGNPHPVENGFAWHPTLGTPYIAGSAVKGLVRAYIEGGWCDKYQNDTARRKLLHHWFGNESKDPKNCNEHETRAGGLIFFDAIPVEPPILGADVMTPHMGGWYEQGDNIRDVAGESNKVPADWHDPVPVPFLVVTRARFLFSVAPRRPELAADVREAMETLKDALAYLGAGAKTAVGYGYMSAASSKPAAVSVEECPWVNETIDKIANETHSKPGEVLRGRRLAEAWSALQDPQLKARALADIRARWHRDGYWDKPTGKAATQARKIYGV